MVEENIMYQQPHKICKENVCRIKVRESWTKVPLLTPTIACS